MMLANIEAIFDLENNSNPNAKYAIILEMP